MTWFLFLYRSLLALMPPAFRARHGADALRMAAARVREETAARRVARAVRELADLLLAIPAVRREFARADAGPARSTPLLGGLLFETRQAFRAIRRSRLTTAVAVLVLGVSIGMSTAVFSIADRVLFRPLPYPAADRLVEFLFTSPTITGLSLSGAEFAAAREAAGVFEQVEAYRLGATALRLDGPEPERLNVAYVTPGFLPLLGGRVIGSGFSAEDAAGDAAPVALLAYDYWRSRLGADERAIGALMALDGEPPLRIVGVVDESFAFPTTRRSALPDVLRPLSDNRLRESGRYARGIGRLRDGVPPSAVTDAVPVDPPLRGRAGLAITATPIGELLAYGARNGLFMLLAGVVALLAVGVLDVSGLLVVQAAGREREIVTRRALGAGTGRIARQLLLEGAAIALLSGALGLLVARFGFDALARMVPPQLQVLHAADVDLDARALVFAAAVALVSACLFGLAPLLHLARVGLSTLRAGAGQTPAARFGGFRAGSSPDRSPAPWRWRSSARC
jgi:putative ABC transport system permease protein